MHIVKTENIMVIAQQFVSFFLTHTSSLQKQEVI